MKNVPQSDGEAEVGKSTSDHFEDKNTDRSRISGKSGNSAQSSPSVSVFTAVKQNAKGKEGSAAGCCGIFGGQKKDDVFKPALLLIRHSERLDYVNKDYKETEEGKAWPHDAPLTDRGWELARSEAEELASLHAQLKFAVVATSPYRRCLETASVIAKRLQLPMVLDQEVGEVWEKKMGNDPIPWRQPIQLQAMIKDLQVEQVLNPVLEDGGIKLFGKIPKFPESLDKARNRMVVRFENYIRQSEALKQNFIICTHADGIAAAVSMFERGLPDISQMDFCCRVVAQQKIEKAKKDEGKEGDDNAFARQWDVETKGIAATKAEMTDGAKKYWEKQHLEHCTETQEMVVQRKSSRTKTDKMFDEAFRNSLKEVAKDAEERIDQV